MTGKEILKRAIRLEPTDRAPVIILSGGVWAYNQVGKSLQDSFDMSPEESSDFWVETKPCISSASDVDKLDIGKIKEDPGVQAMLASTKLMKEKMGNDTLLAVSQWGPMTLASLMLGAEDFFGDRSSFRIMREYAYMAKGIKEERENISSPSLLSYRKNPVG